MKKIILSTLALSLIWLSSLTIVASGISSSSIRTQFEQALYARSGGLLSKKKYKKLINPFLNKAENELKCVQFCKQNPNCIECQDYFFALLDYNVVCFYNYVQNTRRTKFSLESAKIRLEYTIKALVDKGALLQDEVKKELQNTELLFLNGNKAFYSALPLSVKFNLLCYKLFYSSIF